MSAPQLLRVSAVAERLAVSKSAAYRLVLSRELPVVKVGERSCRVTEEDLADYIAKNRGTRQ
ncbi:MAG: helix-turn-helix domain-containing protein [Acidobacteria bacterium]|nr:helix-turn-helix domain-containing protein [Acidobacteriota bacterium]